MVGVDSDCGLTAQVRCLVWGQQPLVSENYILCFLE